MSKYHVTAKVAKPYQLLNGDVVIAQPRRALHVPDECDSSGSLTLGLKRGDLVKIEEQASSMVEKAQEVALAETTAEAGTDGTTGEETGEVESTSDDGTTKWKRRRK